MMPGRYNEAMDNKMFSMLDRSPAENTSELIDLQLKRDLRPPGGTFDVGKFLVQFSFGWNYCALVQV